MHSGGIELTQFTYSRHGDNLLHYRGDRYAAGGKAYNLHDPGYISYVLGCACIVQTLHSIPILYNTT